MLKNIGTPANSIERIISEVYKNNVRLLSKLTMDVRRKEILLCKQESHAILSAYEKLLSESTKLVVNNIYTVVESMVSEIIPNFQYNQEFITEIIKSEIEPVSEIDLNFKDIEITTGSVRFYETFFDAFTLILDYELNEDLLIFKYNNDIKTIDFSTLQTNMLRDVSSCRIKHLSMIDAIKMRV